MFIGPIKFYLFLEILKDWCKVSFHIFHLNNIIFDYNEDYYKELTEETFVNWLVG